ncbi:MAG: MmgE/PrpD family protein, partial [Aestuariivirgaceae bacterium]
LTMSDGRLLEHDAQDARGDPEAPLSRDEWVAKAIDLMKFGSVDNGEQIAGAVLAMTKDAPTPDMMNWIG